MTDDDIERRLRAVERTLTNADTPVHDLSDAAAVHERLDALEAAVDDVTERVDALDATVQSLHGYVGDLEAVNDRVERRADAARAAVERLEDERRGGSDAPTSGTHGTSASRRNGSNVPSDSDAASDDSGGGIRADTPDSNPFDDSDQLSVGPGRSTSESSSSSDGGDSASLLARIRASL